MLEDDPRRIEIFRKALARHAVSYVETARACIELLETEKFDVVFLDHDLGGEVYVDRNNTNTGSEVVRWLKLHIEDLDPCFIIHSHNTDEAMNMEFDLKRANFSQVHRICFRDLHMKHFNDPSFLA